MPIYEYACHECGTVTEDIRSIAARDDISVCNRGHVTERIVSVPALSIWNADRPFPNAVKAGDGKFPTKAAYETHLKMNDMAETKTDGKIYRPHGNKVIRFENAQS